MTGDPTLTVVAFGELLLRLDAPGHARIVQADSFVARYTGSEANVAVALRALGLDCSVVSKVPAGELGQAAVNAVRRYGVRTDHVARGGPRLGLLYLEHGAAPRPTRIVYDRTGSSFAGSAPDDYDWPAILAGAAWLHFSGTAVAGGRAVAASLLEGTALARDRGISVSCDLNYRSTMWGPREAARALEPVLANVDVVTGAGEDAARMFDLPLAASHLGPNGLTRAGFERVAEALSARFGLSAVGTVLRGEAHGSARLTGALSGPDRALALHDLTAPVEVDRVGAGDAFTAGIVYGLASGLEDERTVALATALYCLAQTVEGDFALVDVTEVEEVATRGGREPRIER